MRGLEKQEKIRKKGNKEEKIRETKLERERMRKKGNKEGRGEEKGT